MVEFVFEGLPYLIVHWEGAIHTVNELIYPNKIIWPIMTREIDLNPKLLL